MGDNGQLDIGAAQALARPGGLSSPHPGASIGAFPPIADYAYLADCEVGALVAPSGNVEWLCAPQFDAPDGSVPFGIEISPLFALDAAELKSKLEPGLVVEGPIYLR